MHARCDDGSRNRDAEKSECQGQRQRIAEASPVELKRGLEDQRRQQDVEDVLSRERQFRRIGKERNEEPADDQADNVRKPQPPGHHGDQAGSEEQQSDRGNESAGHLRHALTQYPATPTKAGSKPRGSWSSSN